MLGITATETVVVFYVPFVPFRFLVSTSIKSFSSLVIMGLILIPVIGH